jgi:two-component system nitrogen regulation response regulator GlnG
MAPGQTVEIKDLPQDLIDEQGSESGPPTGAAPMAGTVPSPLPQVGALASADAPAEGVHAHGVPLAVAAGAAGYPGINGADKESWLSLLESEAAHMLSAGQPEVMDALGRQFESTLIKVALKHTHGRKNDAAVRLGIGRNTITRKIQELGISGVKDD